MQNAPGGVAVARGQKSKSVSGLTIGFAALIALFGALFSSGPEKPGPSAVTATLYEAPKVESNPVVSAPVPAPTPMPTPSIAAQPVSKTAFVSGQKVAMRREPNTKASVVDRVDNGLLVFEIERRPDWVLVEHSTTAKRGWISARRLSDERPRETERERKRDEEIGKAPKVALTTAAIVAALIRESLAEYHSHSPCACPYDHDRAGRSCGRRSAWSRPGGYSPLCYAADVTPEAITAYRERVAQSRAAR